MVGTAGPLYVIVLFYTVLNARVMPCSAGWALLMITLLYTITLAIASFPTTA